MQTLRRHAIGWFCSSWLQQYLHACTMIPNALKPPPCTHACKPTHIHTHTHTHTHTTCTRTNTRTHAYGCVYTSRELYREKQVVAEERASRIDNSPVGSLFFDFALRVRRAAWPNTVASSCKLGPRHCVCCDHSPARPPACCMPAEPAELQRGTPPSLVATKLSHIHTKVITHPLMLPVSVESLRPPCPGLQ